MVVYLVISNDKNLVVANQLVKGRYTLTKEEQNFIYLMISQINKDDTEFTEYQIHIKDLESAELTQKKYSRYRDFAKSLMSKVITIEDDKRILTANWFAHIEYIKNTGIIRATISKKLKPYLLQLKTEFTQAKLPTLLQFNSKYSSRLYLLLKADFDRQKKHKQNLFVVYYIEDLNNRFELPKSYNQYSNFKDKFLLQSLQEINDKTDLQIDFFERKTGRKITSIEFCISHKEKTESQLRKEIEQTKTLSDYLPDELSNKSVGILLDEDLGFQKHDLKNIFEHYRIEDVEQICHELFNCWDSQKLMSREGYFRGRLKLLNKKKTQNFSFGFDTKLFDEIP
jgi:plasmid replication initiation protein